MTHIAREALEKCRDKFREYEQLHRAKIADINSPKAIDAVMDKVLRNREMAEMCDQAIAALQPQATTSDGLSEPTKRMEQILDAPFVRRDAATTSDEVIDLLVEHLRLKTGYDLEKVAARAADEIERLRAALSASSLPLGAREYLLLASYCGDDNADCAECRPCSDCLAMCNVFDEQGKFLRELGLSSLPNDKVG